MYRDDSRGGGFLCPGGKKGAFKNGVYIGRTTTSSWRLASLSGGWEGDVLRSMAAFRPHLSAVRLILPLVQFHTSQGGETKASQGSFLPRAVQLARDPLTFDLSKCCCVLPSLPVLSTSVS